MILDGILWIQQLLAKVVGFQNPRWQVLHLTSPE